MITLIFIVQFCKKKRTDVCCFRLFRWIIFCKKI